MNITIYHNPRCSKSRETIKILNEKSCTLNIIEYLKFPLDFKTIEKILERLDMKPIQLIRKNELIYKTMKLDKNKSNTNILIKAMVENPILIERPIVLTKNKAIIGRPPSNVLSLF